MYAASWGRCSLIGVLVMSVVVFPSSCFSVSGGWGGGVPVHLQLVSVFALRLVLVSFLRETVAGFFCNSGWASVPV